jgi:magnesium transporter
VALVGLRKQAPDSETIYYIYVIDEGRRVQGFVSLRQLILARPDVKLADLITRDVITVRVDQDREVAAQELARFDFIAIPVVDNQNRLVGIVTHDDVLDVLQEEATEDVQRLGAVAPMEGSYLDIPVPTIIWKRAIWLSTLAAVAVINAEILSQYQDVSRELIWMVSFLPMVLASGGNSGSQSATLVIRTLALGQLTRRENMRMVRRELLVGLALGACVALVGFLAAASFFSLKYGHLEFGPAGVVALAVMLAVLVGSQLGSVLPLIFRGLGMDPALMSNPLIAALSDVLGVVMYYTVAMLLLRH